MMVLISERIREAMNKRGMKQSELCEKSGISKGTLSSYLTGRYIPKQNNIHLLSKALKVNIPWLMGYEDVPMELEDARLKSNARLLAMATNDKNALRLLEYYFKMDDIRREMLVDMVGGMFENQK